MNGVDRDAKSAHFGNDRRHARVRSHRPLSLTGVRGTTGREKAVKPALPAHPFHEIVAVLRLVDVVIPAVGFALARATAVLHNDPIAPAGEQQVHTNEGIAPFSVGRTHRDGGSWQCGRQVKIRCQSDAIAHGHVKRLAANLANREAWWRVHHAAREDACQFRCHFVEPT